MSNANSGMEPKPQAAGTVATPDPKPPVKEVEVAQAPKDGAAKAK